MFSDFLCLVPQVRKHYNIVDSSPLYTFSTPPKISQGELTCLSRKCHSGGLISAKILVLYPKRAVPNTLLLCASPLLNLLFYTAFLKIIKRRFVLVHSFSKIIVWKFSTFTKWICEEEDFLSPPKSSKKSQVLILSLAAFQLFHFPHYVSKIWRIFFAVYYFSKTILALFPLS